MASLTVYPESGYNSYASQEEAYSYFSSRLNSDEWAGANEQAALITAYYHLQHLDLSDIDLDNDEDGAQLQALKYAQLEQALHALKHDLDSAQVKQMALGGLLQVTLASGESVPFFSERALYFLKDYVRRPSITRVR